MSLRKLTGVALLALASITSAETGKGVEKPAGDPVRGQDVVIGCFSSLGGMVLSDTNDQQTQGRCVRICIAEQKPMGATYSEKCYCGDKRPNNATMIPDSICNEPCPGYDTEACGGLHAFTVYNVGLQVNVEEAELEVSSTSTTAPATTSTTSTSTTLSSATHSATDPAKSDTSGKDSKPHNNNAAIAAGVVVGVIGVFAIIGGAFFYVRRRRNSQLEEDHRRNAAVNAFITGGKPPRSSGGMSIADSRMDPVMNRRLSDGSIADNQDYSRRILRVTNA